MLKRSRVLAGEEEDIDSESDSEDELLALFNVPVKKDKVEEDGKSSTKLKTISTFQQAKKVKIDVEAAIGMPEAELEHQLRDILLTRGKLTTKQLVAHFRSILGKSPDAKQVFTSIIRRIASTKKDDGVTYVGLKDDHQFRNARR